MLVTICAWLKYYFFFKTLPLTLFMAVADMIWTKLNPLIRKKCWRTLWWHDKNVQVKLASNIYFTNISLCSYRDLQGKDF